MPLLAIVLGVVVSENHNFGYNSMSFHPINLGSSPSCSWYLDDHLEPLKPFSR